MKNKKSVSKTQKLVPINSAISRHLSASDKLNGWKFAIASGKVPKIFSSDLDIKQIERDVTELYKNISKLKDFQTRNERQIANERKQIKAHSDKIRSERNEAIKNAREEYHETVKNARAKRDSAIRVALEKAESQLKTVVRRKDTIQKAKTTKRNLEQLLASSNEKVGLHSSMIDGLILAAFPGKKNKLLREAIHRGDVAAIKNFKN